MESIFDSYSGFASDGGDKSELEDLLIKDGIKRFIVDGIATDYCVKATVLNGRNAGFQVDLMVDFCRGVSPETSAAAIQEMKEAGVNVLASP
jgi:nicotinamidase/pyrazinamidase